jgi:hypothetical protein
MALLADLLKEKDNYALYVPKRFKRFSLKDRINHIFYMILKNKKNAKLK